MMYISILSSGVVSVALLATIEVAANPFKGINESVSSIGSLVNGVTVILVGFAFLVFFWNLVKYIFGEKGGGEALEKVGYAVLALVIITSVWGLIAFVRAIVGIDEGSSNSIEIPGVKFTTN